MQSTEIIVHSVLHVKQNLDPGLRLANEFCAIIAGTWNSRL
jgi:hypothetical protein